METVMDKVLLSLELFKLQDGAQPVKLMNKYLIPYECNIHNDVPHFRLNRM